MGDPTRVCGWSQKAHLWRSHTFCARTVGRVAPDPETLGPSQGLKLLVLRCNTQLGRQCFVGLRDPIPVPDFEVLELPGSASREMLRLPQTLKGASYVQETKKYRLLTLPWELTPLGRTGRAVGCERGEHATVARTGRLRAWPQAKEGVSLLPLVVKDDSNY